MEAAGEIQGLFFKRQRTDGRSSRTYSDAAARDEQVAVVGVVRSHYCGRPPGPGTLPLQMDATYTHAESSSLAAEAVFFRSRQLRTLVIALLLGVCAAGFWNASVADGFGRDVVAGRAIGGAAGKAAQFSTLGAGFGFLFAVVAGLAATFTACNCVAFAMIPGLVCARDAGSVRREALRSLGT